MNIRFSRESHISLLIIIILLVLAGCRSSGKVEKNDRSHADVPYIINEKKKGKDKGCNDRLVAEALSWMGTPYRYAGSEKGKGTDCSGMVLRVYEDVAGMKLPRNSRKQAEFCRRLKEKEVRPGDLVFFATGRDRNVISHVGIMIDEKKFVHASTRKGVIISDVTTDYYRRTFMMYGRVPSGS